MLRKCAHIFLAAMFLLSAAGCNNFTEALVDGWFGGISDTIAGAISMTFLGS